MAEITLPAGGWRPREYQRGVWRYLMAGGRHAELIWHRRAGKDEVAMHATAVAAMRRPAGYWHMLPEYAQARKSIWDAVSPHTGRRRIDEVFPAAIRRATRNQEMQIELVNGSTWQVVGSDSYDRLVGSTPAGIVYSEWALSNPAARGYLRPIIAEAKGWQVFVGTPRGRNHAHATYQAALSDPEAYAELLTADQTGVFTAAQLAAERASYVADFGADQGVAMYDQEYMCSFDAAILGAVLGHWLSRARTEGRITEGVYDPAGAAIDISSDIGFRDTSSWWLWQPRLDGYGVVGYLGASGRDADDWIEVLQSYLRERGMRLGVIWLPHDARNKTFSARHSPLERFLAAFGADHVRIVPQTRIEHRTNAARRVIDQCWFDEAACADGIDGLASWSYEYDTDTRTYGREPRHDWASHPGDAFSYGCQMIEEAAPPKQAPPPRWPVVGTGASIQIAPLNELWKTVKPSSRRI